MNNFLKQNIFQNSETKFENTVILLNPLNFFNMRTYFEIHEFFNKRMLFEYVNNLSLPNNKAQKSLCLSKFNPQSLF